MTNQASIKYISSLFSDPARISEGDHNSIALFRQTYPYFVPARYILAAEKHRKVPFTPPMLAEIHPYMGNWLMLHSFLDASTKEVSAFEKPAVNTPGESLVTSKKSVDIGRAGNEEKKEVKQNQKTAGFMQAGGNQPKSVPKEIPPVPSIAAELIANKISETAKPVIEEVKSFVPPVVAEVNKEKITEVAKPVIEEVKSSVPPIVAEVDKEKIAEVVKPVVEEVKSFIPPVVAEVNKEKIAEAVKPVVEEVKSFIPPVVAEVNKEKIAEAVKPVIEEVKSFVPPVVAEVNKEKIAEVAKPLIEEVKSFIPPVVAEVNKEKIVEAVKPVVEEVKSFVPPVVAEVNKEKIAEVVKPVVEEVKAFVPPIVAEVNKEKITEAAKPLIEEVKAFVPPVVAEVNKEKIAEVAKPLVEEVKSFVPPVVAEVNKEKIADVVKPVVEEVKAFAPPVVAEGNKEKTAEVIKPIVEEVKAAVPPVVTEVKTNIVADAVVPTPEEVKGITPLPSAVAEEIVGDTQIHETESKPVYVDQKQVLTTNVIPVKVPLISAEVEDDHSNTVPAPQQNLAVEAQTTSERDELISPVYVDDYFLQQGMKVADAIPEEIDELKDASAEEDDVDKSLMVMMSFSEWLLHFKNTTEQQKEEKKDQKALKTMWQKEKLAAAMEEENEEIPENVFEMAVNSITKEDGLASESLADIYIKQGKYDKAIEMYRKLSLRNPKKNAYFARRIEEVLKEKQS